MRSPTPLLLAVGLVMVMGMASLGLADNYLKNTDFKEGSQLWHGDGQGAFLKPDGTEGSEDDPGAIPVIRIPLTKTQVHTVFQDFSTHDAPGKLHITLQVYASLDFKRSKVASDYQTDDGMPNADFLLRYLPDYFEQTAKLKPGEWVTVQATYSSPQPLEDRRICFMVPPGEGVVYFKNPSVTPQ